MIKRLVARTLQGYWRMSRGLTMGAQGVVFDTAGRVVLVRHTYRAGWHFPGGGVERNELAEVALKRELAEEANVHLAGRAELFGLYGNFKAFPSDHIALFVVREFDQPNLPNPNVEIAECQWFAVDALPDSVVQPVRDRLAEICDGRPRSPNW